MKVLIVGGGLQALSCGCSLFQSYEVHIVASDLMSRKSRFFKKVYTDVKADESLFSLFECEHFDVLIPVSDMTVPFVSKNKALIEEKYGVKCGVPDYSLVYQVEDKSRFMSFCETNDVAHPKTVRLLADDALDTIVGEVGFPALIKPDYSVGARGITRVNDIEDLKREFPIISEKYGSCTLQEFIDNKEYYYNVMLYRNKEGKILGSTIIKIVRMYPVGAGSSSCCISVENEELKKICSDCLDKLNWVGMADFDVLQRLDNGEYKIIEINPRVPASLRGAAVSGVNFPEIIVNDTMGVDIPAYEYMPGKTLRYMGIDIMWWFKSHNRFHARPNWFKFFGYNLFYQDIYKEDCSTWWTWLAEGIKKKFNRNKKLR